MTTDPGDEDADATTEAPDPADRPTAPRPEPAVLPRTSNDEQDVGWGERPGSDDRDDDWYLRERPPHHG
jgi:hypothetical protein